APLVIREEDEARAEAGAERRLHLGRVDADDDEARVGDLELVLQLHEAAEVALLLRAPPAAGGEERDRIAAGDLGEKARAAGVVGELEIRERGARIERV